MVRVVILLAWAAVWLTIPNRAYPQAARVSVDVSQGPLTAARHPTPQAVAIPDSVQKKVGYQHWKGAAIGGTLGAVGGVVLAKLARGACSDCPSNDPSVLEVGFVGAGLGGAFGFLVGAASPKYRWVRTDAANPRQ